MNTRGGFFRMKPNETRISTVDPSPIGLFGLAMITLVACSSKLGWTGSDTTMIIPWALFLGSFAQLYAGVKDAQKGNLFGATAFLAYGFFWVAIGFIWLGKNGVFGEGMMGGDSKQLAFAYLGYLIFTIYMTIGSLETNKVLFAIFFLIDLLFLGLSLSTFGIAKESMHMLAAVAEFLISMLAFYGSAATVLNGHFGRVFLPVGKPFGIFKK